MHLCSADIPTAVLILFLAVRFTYASGPQVSSSVGTPYTILAYCCVTRLSRQIGKSLMYLRYA